MKRKILYIDMDCVIADFDASILAFCPEIDNDKLYLDIKKRDAKIDQICETNTEFFHNLLPCKGAIEAVHKLFNLYEVYFLSSPMWYVAHSFVGKRMWIEKHFGELGKKRLILTHRKDLNLGDFLVDDRTRNGAGEFTGFHIHFGTADFPNWEVTFEFLKNNAS